MHDFFQHRLWLAAAAAAAAIAAAAANVQVPDAVRKNWLIHGDLGTTRTERCGDTY